MRKESSFAAVLSAVVLVCSGALILNQKVSAAGEGKISGTVRLDGPAPHMKGIEMSKDPYCAKAHANEPAHLEQVVVGSNGGLQNVVLYITEGLPASALAEAPKEVLVFDQKNCMYTPHVLAMDAGQTDDRQYSLESVPATGSGADREELESSGSDPRKVQHPSLDEWLARRGQGAVRSDRREWQLQHQQRASRKLCGDRLARTLRYSNAKGDGRGG